MISKCMNIVNNMAQEDQDSLLDKLEQYQAMGIPAEKAQRMAASDVYQEILAEEAEFMRLLEEQHPTPVTEVKPEPVEAVSPQPASQPAAEREVHLTWAAKPGQSTGMLSKMGSELTSKDQRTYLVAMRNAMSDKAPNAQTLLGWSKSRYSESIDGSALSGITGWSIQSTLRLQDGMLSEQTKHEINFFLAVNGMLTGQEGMAWHLPAFGKKGLGVEFNLGGKKLSDTQFEEVYASIQQEFKDHGVTPIPSKDGLRFLNSTGLEQGEFIAKLEKAIGQTSILDIFMEAQDANSRSSGRAKPKTSSISGEVVERASSTLRTGSPNLSREPSDNDLDTFPREGVRTFSHDGGTIENDWRQGEGQFRDQIIKAWAALKDIAGSKLPQSLAALSDYLATQQVSVDQANKYFADNFQLSKPSLTKQERESGVKDRTEYPAKNPAQTARAKGAYFQHPDGRLMTLYHGASADITGIEQRAGISFFASNFAPYANEAARLSGLFGEDDAAPVVYPVNVLVNKPFDWRIQAHRDLVTPFMAKYPKGFSKASFDAALKAGKFELIESLEFVNAAKAAGYDAILVRDDKNFTGFVNVGVLDPADVVFAIGVNGQTLAQPDIQFSKRDSGAGVNEAALNKGVNEEPHLAQMRKRVAAKDAERKQARAQDIQHSQREIVGRTTRSYTPEQLAAFANVGFAVKPVTLKERAQALWKDAGKKLAQGIVDQFAPIKELSTEAYGLLRLAKGAAGSFETLLKGGMLKLTDGVYDFDETRKGGVVDRLLKPMQGEHHDFLRWVAANRAESLMGQGKEHLFTQDDVDAIKTLADGTLAFDYTLQHGRNAGQVTRNRATMYADSLVTFNEFNDNVLDMAEQSGLIDPDARAMWASEFYVPFYRVAEAGGVAGASMKGGAVRKQAFKTLKGGTDVLSADLLDNTLMNWASLLDASAKNRAAKASLEAAEAAGVAIGTDEETARQMGKATGNSNGTVWFMDGGVKHYFLVDDPYVLTAITSLEHAGMRNPMMNALSAAKNALTIGVTASPFFKIRNLIRDSVQVIGVGNISYNPLKNLKDGWALTKPENDIYFRLLAGGGTIHFGTMLEGSEAKRVQALVESGVDASTILGDEHKVKAFYRKFIEPGITAYNELGNRGEAINRAALYDQLVKQGVSHADASLQARDLMDFSMQGSFATIRFLTQVLPFANSRLQGMYKLGRSAKENPKRMAYVTGAVALASLALLAAYGDDDDWKKRENWDRDNYWWFKFGGTAFRIPKPFELGAIGTLAERSAELLFDNEMTGKRFRGHVLSLLGDNLSMNPVPQLVKPMLDIYANKDSFSGRPIETMGMERLKSEYRFTGNTSMTARAASTTLNAVTGLVGKESLSPVQVDSLIRGYFGWLGTLSSGLVDMAARQAIEQPTRPSTDLWRLASGGIIANLEGAPSRYVSQVYEQAKVLEEAYGTWRALQKQGKVEEAREFRAANEDQIRGYRNVEAIKGAIAKINQRIRLVEGGGLERDAKRVEVNRLNKLKDQFARRLAA